MKIICDHVVWRVSEKCTSEKLQENKQYEYPLRLTKQNEVVKDLQLLCKRANV